MKTQKIGNFQVDLMLESEGSFAPLDFVVSNFTPDQIEAHSDWLKPVFVTEDNHVYMSFHSYVLQGARFNLIPERAWGPDMGSSQRRGRHVDAMQVLAYALKDLVQPLRDP